MQHKWMGLGTAEFTEEQAAGWNSLEGATEAPLTLRINQVVCVVCGAPYFDAGPDCAGMRGTPDHHWVSLMTVAMTDEEAASWADPDDAEGSVVLPRSVGLACALCGQDHGRAELTCPERVFWGSG